MGYEASPANKQGIVRSEVACWGFLCKERAGCGGVFVKGVTREIKLQTLTVSNKKSKRDLPLALQKVEKA